MYFHSTGLDSPQWKKLSTYRPVYIEFPPGLREPVYMQLFLVEVLSHMLLRVLGSLSKQCLGLCCNPYRVFLRIQNSLGCMNGQTMGFLVMVVLLSVSVVLHKVFLQSPFLRRCLCSMIMLVS